MKFKKNKLIVVLGMHRSGTSAITRGLQALGVNLGETLYGAMPGVNEKGFWEDIHVNTLNVEMLGAIESDWAHVSAISENDVKKLHDQGYFLRATELLGKKVNISPIFAFKDPRVAKLMPFWREVFANSQFDVSYVLAIRNPRSVAMSLMKRDGLDAEQSYLLWMSHVLTSLTFSADNNRVLIDYDRLMQSPDHELSRIANGLGLEVNSTELQRYKSEFLEGGLRHTVYNLNDLLLDTACPQIVREIYPALLEVASDRSGFDALKVKVAQWTEEFERLKSPLMLIDKLILHRSLINQKITDHDSQIASLNQAITERDNQIVTLNQAITEHDSQIGNLNQVITNRDSQIVNLHNSILEYRSSTSWRVTKPLRMVSSTFSKVGSKFLDLLGIANTVDGLRAIMCTSLRVVRNEGLKGFTIRSKRKLKRAIKSVFTNKLISTKVDSFNQSSLLIVPYYLDPKMSSSSVTFHPDITLAVHLHLNHTEMINEFAAYLNNIPVQFDLFVSVPQASDVKRVSAELKDSIPRLGSIVVEAVPNFGRNIAPLIVQFGPRLLQYELIAHIHAGKNPSNNNWADEYQVTNLMGPRGDIGGHVSQILTLLRTNAKIIFPEITGVIKSPEGWAESHELARQILKKHTKLSIKDFPSVVSLEGSVFWARTACLKDFLGLPFKYSDFSSEPVDADGTLIQALERLILILASKHKGQYIRIHKKDSIQDFRHYEEQQDYSSSIVHSEIKALAYYLPQFHPIPENDLWHGKGFTEWTKVRSANPLFEGHYQQHIPHPSIGYYLLDTPDTLRTQAEMMRKSGVHGQVFYHYWFSGKLILDEPAQLLLSTPDIQMPFCFCWANENWTRRWDGNEKEILLGQNYSQQDARDFIRYLIPFFKDPRYIKVEERPVLFIYRPSSIPDSHEYLDIWEKECAGAGINSPYVVAVLTRGATNPKDFGMDAGVERVLHDWTEGSVPEIKESLRQYWPINGSVLNYDDVANFYTGQSDVKDFTYFRSIVPIWDNTARYGSEAYLLHGSTPQRFQEWMESSIAYTKRTLPSDRQFLLINAWNEWAEGAHLEPDTRYGFSYLNSVGRALSDISYSNELNLESSIPSGTKLHINFHKKLWGSLKKDPLFKQRFVNCLLQSTILNKCSVSINNEDIARDISITVKPDAGDADFILDVQSLCFFEDTAIEKMLMTACATGASILANSYGQDIPLADVTDNGSVDEFVSYTSPLLLRNKFSFESASRNFRMRTDARCFVAEPTMLSDENKPKVTTIIRFHKTADICELRNALYCLYAMQDCVAVPLIAAQDLNQLQLESLHKLLNEFIWSPDYLPQIHIYESVDGKGDLRSKMLNESLKNVKTRYAAFLDFDDLLMPFAYSRLLDRLEKTGKAVTFGRVYSTSCDSRKKLLLSRGRAYEYGYTYEDFVSHNHAPLHSFLLDIQKIDLSNINYFDDQRFMEDYYLTLQIFTKENGDWESLKDNFYIGDYNHSVDREHTLAITCNQERNDLLSNPEYMICEARIRGMREKSTKHR